MAKKKPAGQKSSSRKNTSRRGKQAARESSVHDEEQEPDRERGPPPFPIVAIGASAGGLEAATQILEELPANPSVSIIVVQHLSPKVASLLPELLAGHRQLPVHQVTDEMTLEVNDVYVIPPDRQMTLQDGHLRLQARPTDVCGDAPDLTLAGAQRGRDLSSREMEVAQLVAQGFSNKEIAKSLEISVKTVETHKNRLMKKLQLRSRAELVRVALMQGWLASA